MIEFMQNFVRSHDAHLMFVSNQVYPLYQLTEKFSEAFFSGAPVFMRPLRDAIRRINTKKEHVLRLMGQFPDKKFVLMGDSAKKEADDYAELHARPGYADRIEKILIRMVPGTKRTEQEFHDMFASRN